MAPSTGDPKESGKEESAATCALAFLCDREGSVVSYLSGQLPCASGSVPGPALESLIRPEKMKEFVAAVRSGGGVVEREFPVDYGGSAGTILMHGADTPFGILVLANLMAYRPAVVPGEDREKSESKCLALVKMETETARQLLDAVHEIRNPISSIISSCEFLDGYAQDAMEPDQAEIIKGIGTSAETLLSLTGKISKIALRLMGSEVQEVGKRHP